MHGGVKHRKLKLSQFKFCSDDIGEYVVYTENGLKIMAVDIRIKMRLINMVKNMGDNVVLMVIKQITV